MDRGTVSNRPRRSIEYGDFQTPATLANRICEQLQQLIPTPRTILEPTCGKGSLLLAAADAFPSADYLLGADINAEYLHGLQRLIDQRPDRARFNLVHGDIFRPTTLPDDRNWPEPWLIIGNPPWVTNSALGAIEAGNLPTKRAAPGTRGVDAITGKANFDLSEWILRSFVQRLQNRTAAMAMLCKTTVARKILAYAWRERLGPSHAHLYRINARQEFSAEVEACLLVARFQPQGHCEEAQIYPDLGAAAPSSRLGWQRETLIADLDRFVAWQHLLSDSGTGAGNWRSGLKHDCAAVFELREVDHRLVNGLGETVDIEPESLYPLLKSTDLFRGRPPRRSLVVTQHNVNDDTARLRQTAPRTWQYLLDHGPRLDARRSSIYRRRSRFAQFGIGPYTFSPWKVAVSGLHKQWKFSVIGNRLGRPVVLDDTAYFLPCDTEDRAIQLANALNSRPACEFYSAFTFWDAKRPINAELLKKLDLEKLLGAIG